jgi:uncharacterized protein
VTSKASFDNMMNMNIPSFVLPVFLAASASLSLSQLTAVAQDSLKVLIVDGQNNHNWRATTPLVKRILEKSGRFTVDVSTTPPAAPNRPAVVKDNATPQQQADAKRALDRWDVEKADYDRTAASKWAAWRPKFRDYSVVFCNYNGEPWPEEVRREFVEYVRAGGGVVIMHAADNAFPDWPEYNEIIGLGGWNGRNEKSGPYVRWREGKAVYETTPGIGGAHGRQHEYVVEARQPEHPILQGLPLRWKHTQDELYAQLRGPAKNITILATAFSARETGGTGENEPILITVAYGQGRVFHTMMGDGPPALACVGFQVTLQRGTEWAATGKVTLTKVPDDFPTADKSSARK